MGAPLTPPDFIYAEPPGLASFALRVPVLFPASKAPPCVLAWEDLHLRYCPTCHWIIYRLATSRTQNHAASVATNSAVPFTGHSEQNSIHQLVVLSKAIVELLTLTFSLLQYPDLQCLYSWVFGSAWLFVRLVSAHQFERYLRREGWLLNSWKEYLLPLYRIEAHALQQENCCVANRISLSIQIIFWSALNWNLASGVEVGKCRSKVGANSKSKLLPKEFCALMNATWRWALLK